MLILWNSLDFAHRRAVEGFAGTLSTVPDLPQMVPALAKRRRV